MIALPNPTKIFYTGLSSENTMTKHPLTDKMCLELSGFLLDIMAEDWAEWQREDMRSAADWQLKQVIEWLKVNLMKHDYYEGYAYLYDDCSNAEIEVDKVLEDLKQAMRPQQQHQQLENS